jgi:3-hydroxyisobutyrate dehydrogenase-like beta-hydroxyacid dehydrogenase
MQALPCVGILYPGELGAALGKLLLSRGASVVTTLEGRSQRTAQHCLTAGFTTLSSLEEVIRQSDIVISLVPPAAAEDVAEHYFALANLAPANALYLEANSISPNLAISLAHKAANCGRDFVDASIHGPAKNLAEAGTLYLSGPRAAEVARLWEGAMRVRVLGAEPGRASAMKMILAGISKGICALYLEAAMLARRQGLATELNSEASRFYPGLLSAVERMLPTYPRHAGRRATEMHELEETALSVGQEPCMFAAIHRLLAELAEVPFDGATDENWTVASVLDHLAKFEFLTGESSAQQTSRSFVSDLITEKMQ